MKIDQSFVRNLSQDSDDQSIVQAILGLAHSLDMLAIAEGVETREQQSELQLLGAATRRRATCSAARCRPRPSRPGCAPGRRATPRPQAPSERCNGRKPLPLGMTGRSA